MVLEGLDLCGTAELGDGGDDSLSPLVSEGGKHAEPVTAGRDHIAYEYDLEEQEQKSAEDLAAGDRAEAHNNVRGLGLPVALYKRRNNVCELSADGGKEFGDALSDSNEEVKDRLGNGREKAQELIHELLPFRQPQKFEI